MKEKGKW